MSLKEKTNGNQILSLFHYLITAESTFVIKLAFRSRSRSSDPLFTFGSGSAASYKEQITCEVSLGQLNKKC